MELNEIKCLQEVLLLDDAGDVHNSWQLFLGQLSRSCAGLDLHKTCRDVCLRHQGHTRISSLAGAATRGSATAVAVAW